MSTRATYSFTSRFLGTVTFYIHSDGYPAWACRYFHNAVTSDAKGTFADKFFRANPKAELTRSHDTHGDTEYRYSVTIDADRGCPSAIRIEERQQDDTWALVFAGSVHDFINQQLFTTEGKLYNSGPNYPTLPPVVVQKGTRGHLTTVSRLLAQRGKAEVELAAYRLKFPHYTGNIDAMAAGVRRFDEALDAAFTDVVKISQISG